MPGRLVVLPSTLFSPRTVEAVPSNRAALDRLRAELTVEVFHWPYMKGGPPVASTWQGEMNALREMLAEDCHVLSFGGTAALAVVAMDDCSTVRSFTCDGMFPPPATLRHLGLASLAEAAEVTIRASRTGLPQYVRYLMQDGTAGDVANFVRLMEEDIDWAREQEHGDSCASLDLLEESPLLEAPALCLQLPIPIAGYDEDATILRRFVPRAVVEPFEPWGFNDTAGGVRLAERVLSFMREVEGERSSEKAAK
jgi:hypothetical protein